MFAFHITKGLYVTTSGVPAMLLGSLVFGVALDKDWVAVSLSAWTLHIVHHPQTVSIFDTVDTTIAVTLIAVTDDYLISWNIIFHF